MSNLQALSNIIVAGIFIGIIYLIIKGIKNAIVRFKQRKK